ncbi:MAG: hypothetical protein NTZ34_13205 [Chloroflexi bacterium]|nr:hypothetical protein [Chloroflexota bacterium]
MKKEILTAEAPVVIGDVTLKLLVKQSISWFTIKGVLYFNVIKQPVYAVLSRRGSSKVLDMLGQEISIHQVKLEYPGLDVAPEEEEFLP